MRDAMLFVPDWLDKRTSMSPDKTALEDVASGETSTYRAWNERANQTARFLSELGVVKGDRVAVLCANCLAYLDVWFSCNKTGAIMQTLNWRLTPRELSQVIADASPRALLYSMDFAEVVVSLQSQLKGIANWIGQDGQVRPADRVFADRDACDKSAFARPEISPDDPWVICYTGGTTGLPKGALITYRAVQANAAYTIASWGLDRNDVAILNTPLFHTGGLNVFTAPLVLAGGTSLVCKKFDVQQTFDLIEKRGVTVFFGVPAMFIAMQQHPAWQDADFGKCKIVISGGAPTPLEVLEKFWARGVSFKTGYGLTEAGPNNFWLQDADVRRKPGFVGKPMFHVDVALIDERGFACPDQEIGELLIRGPHVCGGYWNNPEETAKTIVGNWLHTGDLARRDEEGFYQIVGRLKDMIISGGENIYPAEIESAIFGHHGVVEVAVIGVPHSRWGEVGCAVVVPADKALTSEELARHCRERLAEYKVPKHFVFVSALPKTGPGKIDKAAIRAELGDLFRAQGVNLTDEG